MGCGSGGWLGEEMEGDVSGSGGGNNGGCDAGRLGGCGWSKLKWRMEKLEKEE